MKKSLVSKGIIQIHNAATSKNNQISYFTLVELLVVIAILSILAALILPTLSEAVRSAKVATCTNNLKQWGMAHLMYSNDADNYFPYGGGINYSTSTDGDGKYEYIQPTNMVGRLAHLVIPYLASAEFFVCPLDPATKLFTAAEWAVLVKEKQQAIVFNKRCSYGYYGICNPVKGFGVPRRSSDQYVTGLMSDARCWQPNYSFYWPHDPTVGSFSTAASDANVLFSDGHLENMLITPSYWTFKFALRQSGSEIGSELTVTHPPGNNVWTGTVRP